MVREDGKRFVLVEGLAIAASVVDIEKRIMAIDRNTAPLDALEARVEREGTRQDRISRTSHDDATAIAALRAELASDQTERTRTWARHRCRCRRNYPTNSHGAACARTTTTPLWPHLLRYERAGNTVGKAGSRTRCQAI